MSNAFEAFGIKHISASALNKWNGCRGAWVAHYIYGLRGEGSPAMWRGSAVEDGLTAYVTRASVDPLDFAMMTFERDAQGDAEDEVDNERELIPLMLEQAKARWDLEGLGRPVTQQARTECWIDGVMVPMVGYADYIMDGWTLDLKTTKALPSKPKPEHVRQVAGYAVARGEERAGLLYVTGKKSALYIIDREQINQAHKDTQRLAVGLQSTLSAALRMGATEEEARMALSRMCPPDTGSFYWNTEGELEAALATIVSWQ